MMALWFFAGALFGGFVGVCALCLVQCGAQAEGNHYLNRKWSGMIYRVEQISRLPVRKHEVKTKDGYFLYVAGVPQVLQSYLDFPEGQVIVRIESLSKAVISFQGIEIGEIIPKLCVTKKVLFLPIGYEYYSYRLHDKQYEVYESGLGPDKHFYTLYYQGKTTGIIHKDDLVLKYRNNYTVYTLSEQEMKAALIYTMFLEAGPNCHKGAAIDNLDSNVPYYTKQKELREKFDPDFLRKVLAQDS